LAESIVTRTWTVPRLLAAAALLGCGDGIGPTFGEAPPNPADARFVTSDIANFWLAYDGFGSSQAATAFQIEYLDRASPGLRDFMQARNVTAVSLAQMVGALPAYFTAIRPNTLRLTQNGALLDRIRSNYDRIETLYPAAVYPPVTFLIGRFSTGGTIRQSGMLIGTEFFAIDDATPLHELPPFQRANVKPLDSIPLIVAHEHTHILQAVAGSAGRSSAATLLEQSLMEGSADFVGELVSGGHINKHIHAYALPREAEIWAEFQLAMNGRDVSRWLYNQGSSTGERPGDLGYFIGYRIARAYYDRATDKAAALREIIEVRNATSFLAASGYSGGG
jgi:hypothetical protein